MSDLNEGDPAPEFDLPTDDGGNVSLAELTGQPVVLYFYPKDDTPGCTTEAIDFSALADDFAAAGAAVIGVSKDSLKAHERFRAKHDLKVRLAADETGATVEAYGAWVEKSMYGRQYMGIDRSTVLIDRNGKVARLWRKVKVKGHAQAVLEAVRALP